ncbi:MAG: hypothetical protein IKB16_00055 [Lentisphaeria bacterium]|nr:hypothetical protein [Lentisphaeria bacterium]
MMSLLEAIKKLFMSDREIRRMKERERARAFNTAENALESVQSKIRELKKARDKAWEEARNYLRDGQKVAAQQCLQTVQQNEINIGYLERKAWVFSQQITKMEMSDTDNDFSNALKVITATAEIDPDKIADTLEDTKEILDSQAAINKIWDKEYAKEMNGLENSDAIPSMEEMMSNLEKEVIADVSGGKISISSSDSNQNASIHEEIGAGRRKLKEMLEDKK